MKFVHVFIALIGLCISFGNTQAQEFNSFLYHYRITKDFVKNHDRYDQDMKKFHDSYEQLLVITHQETTVHFKSEFMWELYKTVHNYLQIVNPVYELIDQALHNPEWNKNHHYWLTIRFGLSSIIKRHEKEIVQSLQKADSLLNSYLQLK